MGKKAGSSWLTAVKRAFRSPTKETAEKRSNRRRDEHSQDDQQQVQEEEEEDKKREKRRWLFRKPTNQETATQHTLPKTTSTAGGGGAVSMSSVSEAAAAAAEQRHAIAVAMARAAAAEAAVATAQAAMEVARLARPPPSNFAREKHYAATVIQTAFRGYLARRALRALKGLVKLQALVRGHNVRKQAKMTLQCMQALVRVQARVLDQRIRHSQEGGSRKSAFSDSNSLWESRYPQDTSDRKSMSRDGSSVADDWDERPHSVEEVKAMIQNRKEAALKREKTLSQAFSEQMPCNGMSKMGRTRRNQSFGNEDEVGERPKWLDRWMAAKPWESKGGRASTDQRDSVKTVEIDSSQPYSYLAPNLQQKQQAQYPQQHHHHHHQRSNSQSHAAASPLHRAHQNLQYHSPATPSPSKTRPLQVRSASPRYAREERSYQTVQTPSLRSNYHYNGSLLRGTITNGAAAAAGGGVPNYMAATESAKAKARSQSAPRQRPSTPERERGVGTTAAKKRLSFPVPADPYSHGGTAGYGGGGGGGGYYYGHNNHMKSPSFKSVVSHVGLHLGTMEQQSNYSSCYTDSLGGEISPSSTTDLRRWLR